MYNIFLNKIKLANKKIHLTQNAKKKKKAIKLRENKKEKPRSKPFFFVFG